MFDWRTLVLVCLLFGIGFAGVWWIVPGAATPSAGASAPKAPTSPSTVAAEPTPGPTASDAPSGGSNGSQRAGAPRLPVEAKAPTQPETRPQIVPDSDPGRDAVVHAALMYGRSPCRQDVKALYVGAATNYAERLMRSAGCTAFPSCRLDSARLEQVWRLNRTPSDRAATEAMAAVNAIGGVFDRDFQGHVGRAVRVIASSDFKPGPSCSTSTRTTHTVRIRIGRRR